MGYLAKSREVVCKMQEQNAMLMLMLGTLMMARCPVTGSLDPGVTDTGRPH